MPPSAFKPPRATLRAEHRNRFGGSSLPARGYGAHLPMPVALRATTIVAAPADCGILRAAAYMKHWQPRPVRTRGRAAASL